MAEEEMEDRKRQNHQGKTEQTAAFEDPINKIH